MRFAASIRCSRSSRRARALLLRPLLPRGARARRGTWWAGSTTAASSPRRSRAATSSPCSSIPRRARPPASVCSTPIAMGLEVARSAGERPRRFELIPRSTCSMASACASRRATTKRATVYAEDPAEVARGASRAIAIPRLHVVDLDGARAGRPAQRRRGPRASSPAVGRVPVQLGRRPARPRRGRGGARARRRPRRARHRALREPGGRARRARRFPGRIAVGIDARDGRVAVEGWRERSEKRAARPRARASKTRASRRSSTPTSGATACSRARTSRRPPRSPTASRSR